MEKFSKLDLELAYLAGKKSEAGDVEYSKDEKLAIENDFESWFERYTEDNENK